MKRLFMGKFLYIVLTICVATISALASCAPLHQKETGLFIAVEWNLQALFDGKEHGNEYREYRESEDWAAVKYTARLVSVSQAVSKMLVEKPSSKTARPDLIGFIEVENAAVLEDLANRCFPKNRTWTAFASLPSSPLGIGFISRYPLKDIKAHSIDINNETAPRPVLEVRVEPDGKPLVFLLCHWKSKLGGEKATEASRRASAKVVQRRLLELTESEEEIPVIIMGDLNENHDEFYRRGYLCALLPDDPKAAALAKNDQNYLVLSREKPPKAASFPRNTPALYSPWYEETENGSYHYKDEWETIDHMLLSEALFDGSGWEFKSCRTLNQVPFTTSSGKPDSYIPRSGRGLSDHLPLMLYIERKDTEELIKN